MDTKPWLPLCLTLLYGLFEVNGMTVPAQTAPDPVCESAPCYDIAEELQNSINASADPCSNFFEYACGNWVSRHTGSEYARKFEKPMKVIAQRVKEILETDYKGSYPPLMQEAITFYNQCKRFEAANGSDTLKIYDHIKNNTLSKLGGWPIVTPNWDESKFNFDDAVVFLHTDYWVKAIYDLEFLFAEKTGVKGKAELQVEDINGEFGRILTTSETAANWLKEAVLANTYDQGITSMVQKFFPEGEGYELTDEMNEQIIDMRSFAMSLFNITKQYEGGSTGPNYTLTEIGQKLNNSFWSTFYKRVFPSANIDDNQKVFTNLEALEKAQALLKGTKKRTIANYLIWKFLNEYTARFADCVAGTQKAFIHPIGAVYASRYLDDDMFNEIVEYVNDLRGVFDQLFDTAAWMDEETRKRAKNKLKLIKTHVGYPKMYKNPDQLREYFKGLQIAHGDDIDTFMRNVDSTFKFESNAYKTNWIVPRISLLYNDGAIGLNAAYLPLGNSIVIFNGILIEPFYHPARPRSMNYGSIGYVIGHELTHAFDSTGRKFDELGNERNWWTNHSAKGYDDRYQCFLEQFSKIAENSTTKTEYSKFTAGENIADSGGIREAFELLKKLMNTKPDIARKRLPGKMSKYTPEQLFFLSNANTYCAYFPDSSKFQQKYTDEHSLDSNRILGNVMNSPEFGQAFNCPTGTSMNPSKKCSLFA